ncbi:MAG: hypothetical protein QOG25_3834 [Acetobacteraceae bacterium]|nr:hypothetical protein [Acetobacteraceae bacterium]
MGRFVAQSPDSLGNIEFERFRRRVEIERTREVIVHRIVSNAASTNY